MKRIFFGLIFFSFVSIGLLHGMQEKAKKIDLKKSYELAIELAQKTIDTDKVIKLLHNGASIHAQFLLSGIYLNPKIQQKYITFESLEPDIYNNTGFEHFLQFTSKNHSRSVFGVLIDNVSQNNSITKKTVKTLVETLLQKDKYGISFRMLPVTEKPSTMHAFFTAQALQKKDPQKERSLINPKLLLITPYLMHKNEYTNINTITYAITKTTQENVTRMEPLIELLISQQLQGQDIETLNKNKAFYLKETLNVINSKKYGPLKTRLIEISAAPFFKHTFDLFMALHNQETEQANKAIITALQRGANLNAKLDKDKITISIKKKKYKKTVNDILSTLKKNPKKKQTAKYKDHLKNLTNNYLPMIAIELAAKDKKLTQNALTYFTYLKEKRDTLFKFIKAKEYTNNEGTFTIAEYALHLLKQEAPHIIPILKLIDHLKFLDYRKNMTQTIAARRKMWKNAQEERNQTQENNDAKKEQILNRTLQELEEETRQENIPDQALQQIEGSSMVTTATNGDNDEESGSALPQETREQDDLQEEREINPPPTISTTTAPPTKSTPYWNIISDYTWRPAWNGVKNVTSWIGNQIAKLKFW